MGLSSMEVIVVILLDNRSGRELLELPCNLRTLSVPSHIYKLDVTTIFMNTKFTRLYTAISSVDTSTVALPYPYFISGFCDGESTFTISITKDNRERKTSRRLVQNREIYSVHPSFAISLNGPNCNIARAKPLEKIQRKGLH